MSNLNKVVHDFCQDHRIRIVDNNKRAHRFTKMHVRFFNNSADYNLAESDIVRETESLYTIEIAESELKRIAEFESEVFNNMKTQGQYNMFKFMTDQKEEEAYLKDRYPAVKKAYEQYSLMLKLAKSGEL